MPPTRGADALHWVLQDRLGAGAERSDGHEDGTGGAEQSDAVEIDVLDRIESATFGLVAVQDDRDIGVWARGVEAQARRIHTCSRSRTPDRPGDGDVVRGAHRGGVDGTSEA